MGPAPHLLAVSVARRGPVPAPAADALRRVGLDAAALTDGAALVAWHRGGGAEVLASVETTLDPVLDVTACAPSTLDPLERWVATTLPPAARAERTDDGAGSRIRIATDQRAIAEVYRADGPGWALVSSCPLVLAAATGAAVDEEAVVIGAALGHFLGDASPWVGVRRLRPREIVELRDGVVRSRQAAPAASTAASLADAVRLVVGSLTDRPVGLGIELSGGLDSRVLLAAAVATDAPVRRAFTIGGPGDEDRRRAVDLASRTGLHHDIVDPADLDPGDTAALVRLAVAAGTDRGWVANPIDAAVLQWVEERRGPDAGLSGQNGEIARGFYYRGPHRVARPDRRVAALARWRLLANAANDPRLLRADLAAGRDDLVEAAVAEWLDPSSYRRFLESTDDFYLRHRMSRWVGPAYGAAARRHPVVAPFLSVGFVHEALRLSPGERRHSTAMAAVAQQLAPDLAALPLAHGPAPARLAQGTRRAALAGLDGQRRKAWGKVRQRLGGAPARPVGTPVVAAAVASCREMLVDMLADDPLLSPSGLALARTSADARDLAFLLSLAAWRAPDAAPDLAGLLLREN